METVFVTVGTTHFDSLIETIMTQEILKILVDKGCKKILIQKGDSKINIIKHKDLFIEAYSYKSSILDDIKNSNIVIGHCGAGTILDVLRLKKPLLVVINQNLMGNHQQELADTLTQKGYLHSCKLENLKDALASFNPYDLKLFPEQNSQAFTDFIDSNVKTT